MSQFLFIFPNKICCSQRRTKRHEWVLDEKQHPCLMQPFIIPLSQNNHCPVRIRPHTMRNGTIYDNSILQKKRIRIFFLLKQANKVIWFEFVNEQIHYLKLFQFLSWQNEKNLNKDGWWKKRNKQSNLVRSFLSSFQTAFSDISSRL